MSIFVMLSLVLSFGLSAQAAPSCEGVAHSVPQFTHGKLTGCRLKAIDPGSLYIDLGLKVGDILLPEDSNDLKAAQTSDLDLSVDDLISKPIQR